MSFLTNRLGVRTKATVGSPRQGQSFYVLRTTKDKGEVSIWLMANGLCVLFLSAIAYFVAESDQSFFEEKAKKYLCVNQGLPGIG